MKQVKLDEINESVGYIINNMSVTGQVLTLDSGQSLGWSNTRSKKFENDWNKKLSTINKPLNEL